MILIFHKSIFYYLMEPSSSNVQCLCGHTKSEHLASIVGRENVDCCFAKLCLCEAFGIEGAKTKKLTQKATEVVDPTPRACTCWSH